MIDLPAGGYVTLPLLTAGPVSPKPNFSLENQAQEQTPVFIPGIAPGLPAAERVVASGWTLQNRFYKLQIDSTCGAVRSLVSQSDGYEWVSQGQPWNLGQFIYETNRSPRGRADMQTTMESLPDSDRQSALAPLRRGPQRVLDCAYVPGAGKGRLALRLEVPGVEDLRVQVILGMAGASPGGSLPRWLSSRFTRVQPLSRRPGKSAPNLTKLRHPAPFSE